MESLVVIPKDEAYETKEKDEKELTQSLATETLPEKKIVNVDKNTVYLEFKQKEGKEYNDAIMTNHEDLKEKKHEIKQLTFSANNVK